MASCNDHDHHNHDHSAEPEYDYDISDGPLAGCCAQDAKDAARANKLRSILQSHDRTTAAVNSRQALYNLAAPAPPSAFDDDDDDLLNSYEATLSRLQYHESLSSYLNECSSSTKTAVLWLMKPGQQSLHPEWKTRFQTLSVINSTVLFHVVALTSKSINVSDCFQGRFRNSFPCILAIRNHTTIIDQFVPGRKSNISAEEEWDGMFIPWLQKTQVLLDTENTIAVDDHHDSEEEEEHEYDCGKENCRIRYTYAHEHIGSSETEKSIAAAWRM